jgi:Family of unknown function (DUF6049)
MQTVRCVVRALRAPGALAAVLLAVSCLVLGVPAVQASASDIQHRSSGTTASDTRGIAISITGMTPQIAKRGDTITVTGALANHTGSAISGITVRAQTSTLLFSGRSEMASFSASGSYPYLVAAGAPEVTGTVRNGETVRWSVSFAAATFYGRFGVYPLEVQAMTPRGGYTAAARTFLPYWPGGSASAQPQQLQVAWIWPLVDTPQQGACSNTLATSRLAGSVASGGRLSTLLDAGATSAQDDQLTWDIDPALLSDVSVMTHPTYHTDGSAKCSGRFTEKASPAASEWLAKLKTSTAGQPAFLTPYANVDVAALSHAGLDAGVRTAYQVGDTVAGQILPGTFGANGGGTGNGAVLKAAWPADGLADAGVLTSLANDGGINTVVLSSGQLPSSTPGYDNALGRTTSGIGTPVSVLLADSGITSLLGRASADPTESGQFTFVQDFIAQTAMISSEAPNSARSLVIAPPTDWDPSPTEAAALLSITRNAPWMRSVTLSALVAESASLPSTPLPAKQVSRAELSATYLDRIREVQASAALFTNLLYHPPARLVMSIDAAVAVTESAAWRGSGSPGGWLAWDQLYAYLSDSEHKVLIIPGKKLLLAGTSGKTFVSVKNGLSWPIQVRVVASTPPGSQLAVGPLASPLTVQANETNTAPMPVHSASLGTSTVQLELVTQDGSPLAWTAQPLSVEVTRFGRSLLIIIGGALGILVLTSAFRLRRKRKTSAAQRGTASEMADAGGAG